MSMKTFKQKDLPLRLTTGLYSTLVIPAYHMDLKMIKQIIKHIIRSITLNIIITKLLDKYKDWMKKSKHDHNINLETYQTNDS